MAESITATGVKDLLTEMRQQIIAKEEEGRLLQAKVQRDSPAWILVETTIIKLRQARHDLDHDLNQLP